MEFHANEKVLLYETGFYLERIKTKKFNINDRKCIDAMEPKL